MSALRTLVQILRFHPPRKWPTGGRWYRGWP